MKQLKQELENNWYKYFENSVLHKYSKRMYQKNMWDYYINCIVYDNTNESEVWDVYEFEAQFTVNDKSINIETVSWFSDPNEKYRKYPKLQEAEEVFEKLYKAYKN